MSQKTARSQRQSNGAAIENLLDLNEVLGFEQKAAMDVDRVLGLAASLHILGRAQTEEGLKDADVVPGQNPERKTFKQQRTVIEQAKQRLVAQIKEDGYWALVEQKLHEAKSR